jgi:hypothetical protein
MERLLKYMQSYIFSGRCLLFDWFPARDSVVGIVTRNELDGPGIESRWGREFPHPSRSSWGPPSLLYNGYRVIPGGKEAGAWRWPPTPSSAEIKEVELCLYSISGPSYPVPGWTLPLPYLFTDFHYLALVKEWNTYHIKKFRIQSVADVGL